MNNILLISEDTLKTYSNLNNNTFGKWILPAIKESQEMGLMPIIGECLYNKICELVADGSINDIIFTAYKDLLDNKIQPYLIYKTLSNIIPIINAKMANIGTVLTNDEHVINLTPGESDLLKTYYSERCDFYTKRLQDFIKNNASAFPEIACGCGNMQPNLESSESSVGVWLGGSRGKKIGDNKCACSSTEVTCADYQSGFTDGVEFQKRKLQITAITENGRYISEDGYKEVTVNVPQTGGTYDGYDEGLEDGLNYGSYLTFKIVSGGTIGWWAYSEPAIKTIYYSINNGEWIEITSATGATPPYFTVQDGDVVRLKGNNDCYCEGTYGESAFRSTCEFEVCGNIMSLIYGDNFVGQTVLPTGHSFCYMFSYCQNITSIRHLILPATALTEMCYTGMFSGCRNVNYVKCLATSFESDSTAGWLRDTSPTGVFVKKAGVEWQSGNNGIPENWVVQSV